MDWNDDEENILSSELKELITSIAFIDPETNISGIKILELEKLSQHKVYKKFLEDDYTGYVISKMFGNEDDYDENFNYLAYVNDMAKWSKYIVKIPLSHVSKLYNYYNISLNYNQPIKEHYDDIYVLRSQLSGLLNIIISINNIPPIIESYLDIIPSTYTYVFKNYVEHFLTTNNITYIIECYNIVISELNKISSNQLLDNIFTLIYDGTQYITPSLLCFIFFLHLNVDMLKIVDEEEDYRNIDAFIPNNNSLQDKIIRSLFFSSEPSPFIKFISISDIINLPLKQVNTILQRGALINNNSDYELLTTYDDNNFVNLLSKYGYYPDYDFIYFNNNSNKKNPKLSNLIINNIKRFADNYNINYYIL